MTRNKIDTLWKRAVHAALNAGEDYARYHFAALVAAAEREACAKVCDAVQEKNEDDGACLWEAKTCAAAIRARSKT
jgi:hypothetical protein